MSCSTLTLITPLLINHSRPTANSSSDISPLIQNSEFVLIQLGIDVADSSSGASAYGMAIIPCPTRYSITCTNPSSLIWSVIQNSATCFTQSGISVSANTVGVRPTIIINPESKRKSFFTKVGLLNGR